MTTHLARVKQVLNTALVISTLAISGNSFAYYNNLSPLGTNTNEVLEFDTSVPFINLFKASLPFREAVPYLTKGRVDYDNYGWPKYMTPGSQAGTRLVHAIHKDAIPKGKYIVLYKGEGELEYGIDAKLLESKPNRDVIFLDPGKDAEYTVKLIIKKINPQNYIRDIVVVPEGGVCASNPFDRVVSPRQCRRNDYLSFEKHHDRIIFNPSYLKFMRDYKVVRFMNMSGVTRNPIRNWRDRPLVDNATWGGAEGIRGAPLEIMVELANRLHADPWFTIPHAADDNYVRRMAQYIKKNLDPALRVYLEYSNETWNGIFSQHAFMKSMGQQMGMDKVPYIAGYKYYSFRSVQMFRIFEQVFGNTKRLTRVLAGLTGNTRMTETMLSFRDAYKYVDAFAVAPYVFGDYAALRKARTVNQVFKIMTDNRYGHSLPRVLTAVKNQVTMTNKYNVDLVAYEGGQHLIDDKSKRDNQHPNPLFYKANRHKQMGVIYKHLLDGWKRAGGKMFVHFSSPRKYNRFGSKGIKEYITQPDHQAPKQLAVKQFIRGNPCWWQECKTKLVAGNYQKSRPLTATELAQRSGDKAPPPPHARQTQGAAGSHGRPENSNARAHHNAAIRLQQEQLLEQRRIRNRNLAHQKAQLHRQQHGHTQRPQQQHNTQRQPANQHQINTQRHQNHVQHQVNRQHKQQQLKQQQKAIQVRLQQQRQQKIQAQKAAQLRRTQQHRLRQLHLQQQRRIQQQRTTQQRHVPQARPIPQAGAYRPHVVPRAAPIPQAAPLPQRVPQAGALPRYPQY